MADEIEETLGEAELVEGLERKKISGKKILMFGGGALVVLLVIMGVMSLFGGDDDAQDAEDAEMAQLAEDAAEKREQIEAEQDKTPEQLKLLFIEIPPQRYNLNTGGDGVSFLDARIILEIDRESFRADVEAKMPRILDEFNIYMRELRPEDLNGAAGIFRLKEELLMRINQAVAPTRVKDVLIQEFLIAG
jgi:flagellar FliL protein